MHINIDLIYPIGSIYMNVDSTNPQTLFGGTWEQISQGRFLVGQGTVQANTDNWCGSCSAGEWTAHNGLMGGEVKHPLSLEQLPSRAAYQLQVGSGDNLYGAMNYMTDHQTGWAFYNIFDGYVNGKLSGHNVPHNNLPPYLVVYMWKRTA